jgi:hypothetical protein
MPTYNSTNVANKTGVSAGGPAGNVNSAYAEVSITAALTTADTINLFDLPAGSRVLAMTLEATDMDTNGTPTLAINVGDAGSASRYFSASTVGQAGTAAVASAVSGLHYKNTSKTRVVAVPSANAATGAAGTLICSCLYVVE